MSTPTHSWTSLLAKMDASGPPLKKFQRARKPSSTAPTKTQDTRKEFLDLSVLGIDTYCYPTRHNDIKPYFDGYKHGYYRIKNRLMYKTPDGMYIPATGVDSFGPWPDKPLAIERAENEARYNPPPPAGKKSK